MGVVAFCGADWSTTSWSPVAALAGESVETDEGIENPLKLSAKTSQFTARARSRQVSEHKYNKTAIRFELRFENAEQERASLLSTFQPFLNTTTFMSLHLEAFRTGPLDNNEFLLWDDASRELVVIDPSLGGDASLLRAHALHAQGVTPHEIWLTHGHFDHVYGVARWQQEFAEVFPDAHLPVRMHSADAFLLARLREQSLWFGVPAPDSFALDANWEDEQSVRVGDALGRVLHVPGHSPGSVAFYFPDEKLVISGDVLFRGSIGRVDLPGASAQDLSFSLRRLTSLPQQTRVWPGHGDSTTVSEELLNNPYCRFEFRAPQ